MTDQHDTVTADLPQPGAGPEMRILPVGSIVASRTNPRKHFDQAALAELAADVKATGVNQTILVRPLPASRLEETTRAKQLKPGTQEWPLPRVRKPVPIEYELVAGERRWRACQLAEVADIPAMIKNLSDEEVRKIQITENLQREDLTDMEEAEGYESLMQDHGIKAEDIGGLISKSRSYVYARLKLLALCAKAREALRKGGEDGIDFSRALLIARIPNEGLQLKALAYCTKARWNGERPSYRDCAEHIQHEFMLKLNAARFKITDASLVPGAGSCKECSKRTGANPELFADVDGADVCTDPTCYHEKEAAHTAAMVREAKQKGQTVIAGKEANELAVNQWGASTKLKGYRRLDHADDSPTDQPLRKIIGAQMKAEGITPTMIENPRKKGELLATLPNEVALRLLKTVEGQAQAAKAVSKEVQKFADDKKAKAEAKAKAQYEQAWRDQLMARAWGRMSETQFMGRVFTLDVHRYLVLRTVNSLSGDDAKAIAAILGLDKVGAHSALVDFAKTTVSPDFLQLLCVMQRDSSANDHSYGGRIANEGLHLVAGNVFGEAFQEVLAEVKAQARERYLPAATRGEKAPKPSAPLPPAAPAVVSRAKAKGSKGPAARAGAAAPKTTTAEASAQIAAGLAALEGDNQAPAAQGNEAPAVPSGQPAASAAPSAGDGAWPKLRNQAPAAQGDEAPPAPDGQAAASAAPEAIASRLDPAAAWPFPTTPAPAPAAASAVAPNGKDSADVSNGAAAKPGAIAVGVRVRINDRATGRLQKPWIDYEGMVATQIGDRAWEVDIQRSKRCAPKRVYFHDSELEVLP